MNVHVKVALANGRGEEFCGAGVLELLEGIRVTQHLRSNLYLSDLGSRLGDGNIGILFKSGHTLHRLHQVGNKIKPALVLVLYLSP